MKNGVGMDNDEKQAIDRLKYLIMEIIIPVLQQYGISNPETALGAAYLILKALQDDGVKL